MKSVLQCDFIACNRKGKYGEGVSGRCSRCKLVRYCSQECQVKAWVGYHGAACNANIAKVVKRCLRKLSKSKVCNAEGDINESALSCFVLLLRCATLKNQQNIKGAALNEVKAAAMDALRSAPILVLLEKMEV